MKGQPAEQRCRKMHGTRQVPLCVPGCRCNKTSLPDSEWMETGLSADPIRIKTEEDTKSCACYFRPYICRWKYHKNDSADKTGNHIGCNKTIKRVRVIPVNSGNHNIIHSPEQKTSKVDVHPTRNKWYCLIQRSGKVIMIPVCTHYHRSTVNKHI